MAYKDDDHVLELAERLEWGKFGPNELCSSLQNVQVHLDSAAFLHSIICTWLLVTASSIPLQIVTLRLVTSTMFLRTLGSAIDINLNFQSPV